MVTVVSFQPSTREFVTVEEPSPVKAEAEPSIEALQPESGSRRCSVSLVCLRSRALRFRNCLTRQLAWWRRD